MTWVKVCGLTEEEDVAAAVTAGADAVGFVLIPESPRFVTPRRAAALAAVAGSVEKVVLTIDLAPDELLAIAAEVGAGGVQPYGADAALAAAVAVAAGLFVLRPVRAAADMVLPPPGEGIPLLDASDAEVLGGTGRRFDWELATGIERPWVLAGGLGADNVAEAVRALHPWGVDASSGLESAPGVKDHGRVGDFIRKAKQA